MYIVYMNMDTWINGYVCICLQNLNKVIKAEYFKAIGRDKSF